MSNQLVRENKQLLRGASSSDCKAKMQQISTQLNDFDAMIAMIELEPHEMGFLQFLSSSHSVLEIAQI